MKHRAYIKNGTKHGPPKNGTKANGNIPPGTSYLLDHKTAARFLGVKEHTLAVWRTSNRYHIPYIKVGKLVRYRLSDLESFLEKNLHK